MSGEFLESTKRTLSERVGACCSFCLVHTKGASAEAPNAVTSIGEAAHIKGNKPDARRYDPLMSDDQRRAIENGIWLCRNCHGKIDRDEVTFTVALLLARKAEAELRMGGLVGAPNGVVPVFDWATAVYSSTHQDYIVTVSVRNESEQPMTMMGATLTVGTQVNASSNGFPSNRGGFRKLDHRGERLQAFDGVEGSWFFGWSFEDGGERLPLPEGATVGLLKVRLAHGPVIETPVDIVSLARFHDDRALRQLVEQVPLVLSKQVVADLLAAMDVDHLVFLRQIGPFRKFLGVVKDYLPLSAPALASTGYQPLDELCLAVKQLVGFVANWFYPYPSAGSADERDTAFALWPQGNVDRGSPSPEQEDRYLRLVDAMESIVADVKVAYDHFVAVLPAAQK
ncbi:hypothetical protein OV207_01735 [Corallococcus sp. BB11-1]|uniref:HNH endonuclease n=1 Tax=Corallococcus sp. BB11-1 TaxID=2996783 RepID=UPI00226F03DB|nr:HNH endonuclease [Corallococcus sp. BB11-1]MCY1030160.1 hypothetical protein [Corallococcus sp. BB11-1]